MKTTTFRKSPLFRFIAFMVLTAFAMMLPVSPSYAQVTIIMPPPGQMIHITRNFEPPQMVGLKINLKDPFSFDFIMDQGQNPMSNFDKKEEFNKIIKYFLVSLAMPNKEMWVNLSPYESNRIIPEVFAQTEMGRDLLAQDYILKQFTASLMYPEDGLGKKFWDKVYAQAQARFGTTDINVNTFNKVWIVADHADIYQKGDTAFLVKSHLKVMLEQDYMAIEKNKEQFGNVNVMPDNSKDAKGQMASQLVREIIIPAIEKEVNEGKSFAAVRQAYGAEIMATWFKKTLRQSLLGQVFANKSKISGQRVDDPQAKEKIYQQYLKAYKKGVFNYIKEDATPDGQVIPRKYFSGGLQQIDTALVTTITPADLESSPEKAAEVSDFAQTARGNISRLAVVSVLFLAQALGAAQTLFASPATQPTTAPTALAAGIQDIQVGTFNDGDNRPSITISGGSLKYDVKTKTFTAPQGVEVQVAYYSKDGKPQGSVKYTYNSDHQSWVSETKQTDRINIVPKGQGSFEIEDASTSLGMSLITSGVEDFKPAVNDAVGVVTGTVKVVAGTGVLIGEGTAAIVVGGVVYTWDETKWVAKETGKAVVLVADETGKVVVVIADGVVEGAKVGAKIVVGGVVYTWNGAKWVAKETGKVVKMVADKSGKIIVRAVDYEAPKVINAGRAVFVNAPVSILNTIPFFQKLTGLRTDYEKWQAANAKVEALEKRVLDLQSQIGQLAQSGEKTKGDLAIAKAELTTLQNQLAEAKIKYAQSQTIYEASLKTAQDETKAARKATADALAVVAQQATELQKTKDALAAKTAESEQEKSDLAAQKKDNELQIAQNKKDKEALETANQKLKKSNDDLKTAQDQLKTRDTEVHDKDIANGKLQIIIDGLNGEIQSLNDALTNRDIGIGVAFLVGIGLGWLIGRRNKKDIQDARDEKVKERNLALQEQGVNNGSVGAVSPAPLSAAVEAGAAAQNAVAQIPLEEAPAAPAAESSLPASLAELNAQLTDVEKEIVRNEEQNKSAQAALDNDYKASPAAIRDPIIQQIRDREGVLITLRERQASLNEAIAAKAAAKAGVDAQQAEKDKQAAAEADQNAKAAVANQAPNAPEAVAEAKQAEQVAAASENKAAQDKQLAQEAAAKVPPVEAPAVVLSAAQQAELAQYDSDIGSIERRIGIILNGTTEDQLNESDKKELADLRVQLGKLQVLKDKIADKATQRATRTAAAIAAVQAARTPVPLPAPPIQTTTARPPVDVQASAPAAPVAVAVDAFSQVKLNAQTASAELNSANNDVTNLEAAQGTQQTELQNAQNVVGGSIPVLIQNMIGLTAENADRPLLDTNNTDMQTSLGTPATISDIVSKISDIVRPNLISGQELNDESKKDLTNKIAYLVYQNRLLKGETVGYTAEGDYTYAEDIVPVLLGLQQRVVLNPDSKEVLATAKAEVDKNRSAVKKANDELERIKNQMAIDVEKQKDARDKLEKATAALTQEFKKQINEKMGVTQDMTDLVGQIAPHVDSIVHNFLTNQPVGDDIKIPMADIQSQERQIRGVSGTQKGDYDNVDGVIAGLMAPPVVDKAVVATKNVGGINLSDEHLTINIKVDGAGMPLPPQYQDKAMMNLSGLTSIIRKIVPLTPENVPALYELVR